MYVAFEALAVLFVCIYGILQVLKTVSGTVWDPEVVAVVPELHDTHLADMLGEVATERDAVPDALAVSVKLPVAKTFEDFVDEFGTIEKKKKKAKAGGGGGGGSGGTPKTPKKKKDVPVRPPLRAIVCPASANEPLTSVLLLQSVFGAQGQNINISLAPIAKIPFTTVARQIESCDIQGLGGVNVITILSVSSFFLIPQEA